MLYVSVHYTGPSQRRTFEGVTELEGKTGVRSIF